MAVQTAESTGLASAERAAPALSVVVPVKDEAGNILPLIAEIHAALEGRLEFEIVYVDDGSRDATPSELAEALSRYPRLRVVRHREACGQSTALRTGIKAARAAWVATLDGDGQNDPADIPILLGARDALGDAPRVMVAGRRMRRQDSWFRRFCSRTANGVRNRLLKDGVSDTGCSLKLFRRDLFLDMPYFHHMHRFLPALALREGDGVVEILVNHRPRRTGTSKYGLNNRLWAGIVDLLGVMWLRMRTRQPAVETVREPTR
ncbi:MAG: glycosyltransferase family 2 protein [Alphaproteobacteria bacterium]